MANQDDDAAKLDALLGQQPGMQSNQGNGGGASMKLSNLAQGAYGQNQDTGAYDVPLSPSQQTMGGKPIANLGQPTDGTQLTPWQQLMQNPYGQMAANLKKAMGR